MISIFKGKRVQMNQVTVINGRIIGDNHHGIKSQKFDEKASYDCSDIEYIAVHSSFADVNVAVANSSEIDVYLHGEAKISEDINFDVQKVNRELRIKLSFTGTSFVGKLKLDITIPSKLFKSIWLESSSANVNLDDGVLAKSIKVNTQSGDLKVYATTSNFYASTMSGDVTLCLFATENVEVDVSTMSGDVSAEIKNISKIELSASSQSGSVKNRHKNVANGHVADVKIYTLSGEIVVY